MNILLHWLFITRGNLNILTDLTLGAVPLLYYEEVTDSVGEVLPEG